MVSAFSRREPIIPWPRDLNLSMDGEAIEQIGAEAFDFERFIPERFGALNIGTAELPLLPSALAASRRAGSQSWTQNRAPAATCPTASAPAYCLNERE